MTKIAAVLGNMLLACASAAHAQWISPTAAETAPRAVPSIVRSSLSPSERRRVDAVIDRYRIWSGLVGINVAIVRGGRPVYRGAFGYANLELGVANRLDTRFQLSSTAKVLSSLALMRLVEDRVINLDAPIKTYLPEAPAAWDAVTVRHLMQQLSGLPDIFECPEPRTGHDLGLPNPLSPSGAAWTAVRLYPDERFPNPAHCRAADRENLARDRAAKCFRPSRHDGHRLLRPISGEVVTRRRDELIIRIEGGGLELRDYAYCSGISEVPGRIPP